MELGFGTAGTSPAGAIGSAVLAEPGASAGSTCVGDVGALGAWAAARDARHDEPMMSASASGPRPNDVRLPRRCRSICLRSVGGLIGHRGAERSRFSWRLACGVPCIARRPLRAENGPDPQGRRVKCCLELLDLTVTSGSVLTTLVLSRVLCRDTRRLDPKVCGTVPRATGHACSETQQQFAWLNVPKSGPAQYSRWLANAIEEDRTWQTKSASARYLCIFVRQCG
jgi:hypothetical protein